VPEVWSLSTPFHRGADHAPVYGDSEVAFSGPESARYRVLVVEYDADVLDAAIEVLLDDGFDAQGVVEGHAALELIRSNPNRFDVILLDGMMPTLNGQTFLEIRTTDAVLRSIPVILLTRDRQLDDIVTSQPLAASFRKPMGRSDLLMTVRALIGRRPK
jgi:DNA-binding response OmpR family regulator